VDTVFKIGNGPDLLGVSYKTAIRWAAHTGADWNDYIAARDEPHA
jgi:hypothetical protein